jgi:hypothetical protein
MVISTSACSFYSRIVQCQFYCKLRETNWNSCRYHYRCSVVWVFLSVVVGGSSSSNLLLLLFLVVLVPFLVFAVISVLELVFGVAALNVLVYLRVVGNWAAYFKYHSSLCFAFVFFGGFHVFSHSIVLSHHGFHISSFSNL